MAHARRHARAVSCARATAARTEKSFPALYTAPRLAGGGGGGVAPRLALAEARSPLVAAPPLRHFERDGARVARHGWSPGRHTARARARGRAARTLQARQRRSDRTRRGAPARSARYDLAVRRVRRRRLGRPLDPLAAVRQQQDASRRELCERERRAIRPPKQLVAAVTAAAAAACETVERGGGGGLEHADRAGPSPR